MKYKEFYDTITKPFCRMQFLKMILRILYFGIPVVTALIYIYIIINIYLSSGVYECAKVMLVPFVTLILVTLFRKAVNAPRPAENDSVTPLIRHDKSGESFPSRHTASLAVIAMAGLYFDLRIGIILWCMTLVQGIVRIIAGVHYPKDILCGMAAGFIFGLILFI